jgi:hypothetical protein
MQTESAVTLLAFAVLGLGALAWVFGWGTTVFGFPAITIECGAIAVTLEWMVASIRNKDREM